MKTALHLEHLKADITSIIAEETYVQAPVLLAELFEEKTLDIRQEATLYRQTLIVLKDMLEVDSYQGHAFEIKTALKYVNCALGIAEDKPKKIPQIIERDGGFSIEQIDFPLGLQPDENEPEVCTTCGYMPNGVHFEPSCEKGCDECGGYGLIGRDCKCASGKTEITVIDEDCSENYGAMDELTVSGRVFHQ